MIALFSLLRKLVSLMIAVMSLLGLNKSTVTVELYTNPASGYLWEYSYDDTGILTLSESYYIPDSSAILSGGGGTQNFEFSAVSSGTVNITFRYISKIDSTVASEYIYTYIVDHAGNITLQSIQ